MLAHFLALSLACQAAPAPPAPPKTTKSVAKAAPSGPVRVFFAKLQKAEGVTDDETRLIADAILVAARPRKGFAVVGVSDLQGVVELEATKQAAGCDAVSCASELADALDAPQLVTGQLGRVGSTWILTLTRVNRADLSVLAREQVQAAGPGPDAVLPDVPALVGRLLPEPPRPASPLLVPGLAVAGGGLLVGGTGGILVYVSSLIHADGLKAHDAGDLATAAAQRQVGEPLYWTGWIATGLGAALLVGGLATAAAGLGGVGAEP